MTSLLWLTGIVAAALGGTIALFRKGGIYNPEEAMASSDNTTDIPLQAPKTAQERLYELAKASLGLHLSLDPKVNPEEGCAEAMSVLFKQMGYNLPAQGIPAVRDMIKWMVATGFTETTSPTPGCVIAACTPQPSEYCHIGVVMKYGVASNDSRPQYLGHFLENYSSIDHFVQFFKAHSSPTRYFTPV